MQKMKILRDYIPLPYLRDVQPEEAEQKAEELTKKLEAGIRFLVECCQKSIILFIWQVLFPVRSKGHLRYWDLRGYRYWGLSLR